MELIAAITQPTKSTSPSIESTLQKHIRDIPAFNLPIEAAFGSSKTFERPVDVEGLTPLADFLINPLWRRVWCIQEVVLGRVVRFGYGHQHMEWQEIYGLAI